MVIKKKKVGKKGEIYICCCVTRVDSKDETPAALYCVALVWPPTNRNQRICTSLVYSLPGRGSREASCSAGPLLHHKS